MTAPSPLKVPVYQVTIFDGTGKQLATKKLAQGPSDDEHAVVRANEPPGSTVAARLKTFEGEVFVTARMNNGAAAFGQARPTQDAVVATPTGQQYRVAVRALGEVAAPGLQRIEFKPPRVSISADAQGWRVTFEPQQVPCVLTVAVEAQGTKDEALPSCPFPSQPRHKRGTVVIPRGQFGATEGGVIRLGVRGAGRAVSVALPAPGQTVEVAPDHFREVGAPTPKFLDEAYVAQKYAEKQGAVTYE